MSPAVIGVHSGDNHALPWNGQIAWILSAVSRREQNPAPNLEAAMRFYML